MPPEALLELDVGAVAHGGHCVARCGDTPGGRVVFVRHALPGERVRARVTQGGATASSWRADAVEVLVASPDRVVPPCPWAGPGRCGGCDWQHAALPAQRALKATVVREQLQRLARIDRDVVVEPVPSDADGLAWRTRVGWAVRSDGRAGLRRHRSHDVVPVDWCRIAAPGVTAIGVTERRWPGVGAVTAVASGAGDRTVVVVPRRGGGARQPGWPRVPSLDADVSVVRAAPEQRPEPPERVRGRTWVAEPVGGRTYRVAAGGFWQAHRDAPALLVSAVLDSVRPQPGAAVLDLYAGAGLFAGALGEAVGPGGTVVAVESDRRAVADARRNLHDLAHVRVLGAGVERALRRADVRDLAGRLDAVVLDPPRTGARRPVVEGIVALRPRTVAYVACDPAALARDLATFAELGYDLVALRAFDLFPMTHHVECLATLEPAIR